MVEKRFKFRLCSNELYCFNIIDNKTGKEHECLIDGKLFKLLNELNDENNQLREFIMDLHSVIQFDVDNGVKSYPTKTLLDDLVNILEAIK